MISYNNSIFWMERIFLWRGWRTIGNEAWYTCQVATKTNECQRLSIIDSQPCLVSKATLMTVFSLGIEFLSNVYQLVTKCNTLNCDPLEKWFFVNLIFWSYFWFKMNLVQFQVYILRTLCSHKNRNSQWDIALLDTKTIYHDVYKLIWYNWNLFWLKIYENN